MRKTWAAFIVSWFLFTPVEASAQAPAATDWEAVRRLDAGTRVVVVDHRYERITAKVTAVSDDALELAAGWGRVVILHRRDVREVRFARGISPAAGLGLGLLAGAAAGNIAGRAACPPRGCGGEGALAVAAGTMHGAFYGGISGYVIGHAVNARPGRLIYSQVRP